MATEDEKPPVLGQLSLNATQMFNAPAALDGGEYFQGRERYFQDGGRKEVGRGKWERRIRPGRGAEMVVGLV